MSGSTSFNFPIVVDQNGLQPQSVTSLQQQLINAVALAQPGYTANLPGSLIEDMSSTAIGAVALCNQFLVELVNSLTPFGANSFLLNQLGQVYGVPQGQTSNTSVYVVFGGPVGFVIAQSFVVSDGTYQYIIQDGGVIQASGFSQPLFALAAQPGSFAVIVNSVNQLITSVPSGVSLTCNNPLAGTPGGDDQTIAEYRAAVLQAGLVTAQGVPTFMKTLLGNVPGVIPRLVSAIQLSGQWEIIVGGTGDPYAIAYAIYSSLFDISALVGSTMTVTGITNANPGVITTGLNHGFLTGQIFQINGATGLTALNGTNLTATVLTPTTFSVGVNTTSSGTYTGHGVITPNFRNVSVNINDSPNVYTIPFVIPPSQPVTIVITWNTTATNFVSASAVASAVQPAIAAYVNALPVGVPMNLFELQATFQAAVAAIIPGPLLTRMVFSVNINGIGVSPAAGTGIIAGDSESYFAITAANITVNQG